MTKDEKAKILTAGRAALRAWLESAEAHGTLYYTVPHVARSGMSRRITLHTIRAKDGVCPPRVSAMQFSMLWPGFPEDSEVEKTLRGDAYLRACDAVAKDWGFSFQYRAFVIGGCGMDMVFALVDRLAGLAGMEKRPAGPVQSVGGYAQAQQFKTYSNRVHRTQIG